MREPEEGAEAGRGLICQAGLHIHLWMSRSSQEDMRLTA